MKSISLDRVISVVDNQAMDERASNQISEIITEWQQGLDFEENGYEDLGRTLQFSAIKKTINLDIRIREFIVDKIFPTTKHGN